MKAVIYGINIDQVKQVNFVEVSQLPTYPISPPPGAEALGLMTWDLPEIVKYVRGSEMVANIEVSNPSAENRLYVVSYYFIAPNGVIAEEGFIKFVTDSLEFTAFYLPPQSPEPAFFSVAFSASDTDYVFGLRMLLCELTDSVARVIQETSRVQVLLASESTYNRYQVPSIMTMLMGSMVVVGMIGMATKFIKGKD